MIILGFVLGIIATRLWDIRKKRKTDRLYKEFQRGYNSSKLGKFDEGKA